MTNISSELTSCLLDFSSLLLGLVVFAAVLILIVRMGAGRVSFEFALFRGFALGAVTFVGSECMWVFLTPSSVVDRLCWLPLGLSSYVGLTFLAAAFINIARTSVRVRMMLNMAAGKPDVSPPQEWLFDSRYQRLMGNGDLYIRPDGRIGYKQNQFGMVMALFRIMRIVLVGKPF